MSSAAPLSDLSKLRGILNKAKNIVALTGAGVSAESGIPTFRGAGGFWRTYRSQDLASAGAFRRSPSLVWEFYHYRREVVFTKEPNKAHYALAELEEKLKKQGRSLTVITQNIDELHQKAGSKNVVELHGSLFRTRCLECDEVASNYDSPICPSLKDRGAPDPDTTNSDIPVSDLPHCTKSGCSGLLRPHIVWFGENLDLADLRRADEALNVCDACLVIGTSSVVYPAAMYAPELAQRNVPVAEFNMEATQATHQFIPDEVRSASKNNSGGTSDDGGGDGGNKNKKEPSKPSGTEVLTKKQKLKLFMRDYGATVIVFHIGMSLTLLGGIYLVLKSGIDMAWVIQKLGISEGNSDVAAGASTFVVAYGINKVLAPVRFSITFACTPFIVRYLRSVGVLKLSKPKV